MTTSEALLVLSECEWLKVTANHVSASKYKTRPELAMLSAEERQHENCIYRASVQTRRKKHESWEGLLIRAATMIKNGHLPVVRVPPLTSKDRCACGAQSHDLVWSYQLQERMCLKCARAWENAANNNDIAPVGNNNVQ